jgi:hypothetical protein
LSAVSANENFTTMKNSQIFKYGLLLTSLILYNCHKEPSSTNQDKILGKWISVDKSDTLDFADNQYFYHSSEYTHNDQFVYHLEKDSIQIQYIGNPSIFIEPSKYKYTIDDKKLTINFSRVHCVGFAQVDIIFNKY